MKSLRTEINVYTVVVYSFDMYSVRKLFIKLKHVDTIFVHNIKGKVFLHRIGGGVIVTEWCKISTLQPEKLYFARRLRVALRRLCIAFLQREYVWIIFFFNFQYLKKKPSNLSSKTYTNIHCIKVGNAKWLEKHIWVKPYQNAQSCRQLQPVLQTNFEINSAW